MDLAELTQRQRVSLWLDGSEGLYEPADAMRFMDEVGLALRYGAGSLPLASMYRATQRQVPFVEDEKTAHARAFELTNAMLASGSVIETNLIANRLVLAHERVMPALYALRRAQGEPGLSDTARRALEFIENNRTATSGDVRHLLNAEGQPRPDAADLALAELQHELYVDRGPTAGTGQAIFYLTREGYPYRLFAPAHPEVVAVAAQLGRPEAAAMLVRAYLAGAVFGRRRQLATLFRLVLSATELDTAIADLEQHGVVEVTRSGGRELIVVQNAAD